ncbi:hypothetical protein [Bradyrhizobium sp.]
MKLSGRLRAKLRQEILNSFGPPAFGLFVSDHLDLDFFQLVAPGPFENQCQEFILRMEKQGALDRLCLELKQARSDKPDLVLVVSEIADALAKLVGSLATKAPLMIGGRPFLDREDLRSKLTGFIEGNGLQRVLAVCGETASGKSYSAHLISRSASGIRFVSAELPAITQSAFEASHIAVTIWERFWPDDALHRFDDLGQQTRDAKWYGDRLLARLGKLDDDTLLFLDGFNTAPLSKTAAELLTRLCRAVELGECASLWLVLIGLDAAQLGPEYDGIIASELAKAPAESDIADFLTEVTVQSARPVDPAKIKTDAIRLAAILGNKPTHALWVEFNRELLLACKAIRGS